MHTVTDLLMLSIFFVTLSILNFLEAFFLSSRVRLLPNFDFRFLSEPLEQITTQLSKRPYSIFLLFCYLLTLRGMKSKWAAGDMSSTLQFEKWPCKAVCMSADEPWTSRKERMPFAESPLRQRGFRRCLLARSPECTLRIEGVEGVECSRRATEIEQGTRTGRVNCARSRVDWLYFPANWLSINCGHVERKQRKENVFTKHVYFSYTKHAYSVRVCFRVHVYVHPRTCLF